MLILSTIHKYYHSILFIVVVASCKNLYIYTSQMDIHKVAYTLILNVHLFVPRNSLLKFVCVF